MEFCTAGALDAVVGPESLRAVGHFDGVVWMAAGVLGGEGEMVCGVPVLGKDDVLETGGELIDGLDDGIALCDGERAAGAEVALEVYDEEQVILLNLHCRRCPFDIRSRQDGDACPQRGT